MVNAPKQDQISPQRVCDLLVIGSGAGGLAAAVTAATAGLKVIVVEKESLVGGTTAWSGGWLWVPGNPLAQAHSPAQDDFDAAHTYLKNELQERYDAPTINAFLTNAPLMVQFFQEHTEVQFFNGPVLPDFHGHIEGAATGNRAICAAPYDLRKLGPHIRSLRPPLDLMSPMGMSIASPELKHFFNALRKPASFFHVSKRVLQHTYDLVRYGRAMHVGNGNALAARLFKSALDKGVEIFTDTSAVSLMHNEHGVQGAVVRTNGHDTPIHAKKGVVLATGGFPHDKERVAAMMPRAQHGAHWSAAPKSNVGEGLRLGESAGGYVRTDLKAAGGWAPVSLVPEADGSFKHLPHLGLDRAKPGCIMVGSDAKRFVNEADSYHDIMLALFSSTPADQEPFAWMICDQTALRRWGLGRVRPAPFPKRRWLNNAYLLEGSSIEELAAKCQLDPGVLRHTIETFNADAKHGIDHAFSRGASVFNRAYGDPDQHPNPCLAALEQAPYYAIRIVPGSLSTFAGLATNANGQVMNRNGTPIAGLFAAGNDMSSIAAGHYPAGGFTLGPAMTFGFMIARHLAQSAKTPQ